MGTALDSLLVRRVVSFTDAVAPLAKTISTPAERIVRLSTSAVLMRKLTVPLAVSTDSTIKVSSLMRKLILLSLLSKSLVSFKSTPSAIKSSMGKAINGLLLSPGAIRVEYIVFSVLLGGNCKSLAKAWELICIPKTSFSNNWKSLVLKVLCSPWAILISKESFPVLSQKKVFNSKIVSSVTVKVPKVRA
ncbi:hypothetical protein CWATWH0402_1557 [Crocosphaera watsonii WH 0402]|uniref:Uncharacterized protein n=2 Tax=Crocosphaera watsonii TaxID=263511 RepID=T2JJU2_CROWT|nr:hypothetical protein CWATWH0005_3218 [Crocosphaera watsonii WH 0005]CCQ65530.1 hypothetical protein CWATWH0402_1557 [Crocosphaera watsonii WH 0402]